MKWESHIRKIYNVILKTLTINIYFFRLSDENPESDFEEPDKEVQDVVSGMIFMCFLYYIYSNISYKNMEVAFFPSQ